MFDRPIRKLSGDLAKSLTKVDLHGEDRLIVTMADTDYRAVFFKHPKEARLIEGNSLAVDNDAGIYHQDFEQLAWEAANIKARELGWID